MARGTQKKPGEPKCKACGGLLEGKPMVRIGGYGWHKECAEKKGKFIPREYREGGRAAARSQPAPAPAEAAEKAPETVEVEASE